VVVTACSTSSHLDDFDTAEIEVGGQALTVALATTTEQRSQGLRDVETLPADLDGMLFVFEQTRTATFGMEDTLIPLDIWWFDQEGVLVGSAEMEPCETAPCTAHGSPGEVSYALETPSGTVELEPGDVLSVDP
jgi:uncharacterized membrane protein (UPF0127 family)